MTGVQSLVNSVESALLIPKTFRANSKTATCIPKHIPIYGTLFSRAYFAAAILPETPRTPKPPGTKIPSTSRQSSGEKVSASIFFNFT
jgi:hypothetical protein